MEQIGNPDRIGREAVFKKLNVEEKIKFLLEILEHPDLYNGICYVAYTLKYAEGFGVCSFIKVNFPFLNSFGDGKGGRKWFDLNSERVMRIKQQIKILEDDAKG